MVSGRRKQIARLLVFVGFLSLWKAYVAISDIPAYLLPPPEAVAKNLVMQFAAGDMVRHLLATAEELLLGLSAGTVLGVLAGYALARSELLERLLSPYVLIAQTAPKISLAPLFLLWFGIGLSSKVALVTLVVFFPIAVNVVVGIRGIDRNMINLTRILRASGWQRFLYLEAPAALPMMLAGFKIAATQAVTAAIIGELIGAKAGLGFLVNLGSESYDILLVLSSVIVMSVLGLASNWLVEALEVRLIPWHESRSRAGAPGSR